MHHAVEMLLARMESHPEDFSQERSGKWLQIINAYKKFFTEEEGLAIRDGLRKINMESMTEDIMKRMVKEEETREEKYTNALANSITQTKNQSIQSILQAGLDKTFKEAYANYNPVTSEELTGEEGEEVDYKWVNRDYALGFEVEDKA